MVDIKTAKIVFAPQDWVRTLKSEVDKVLEAVGHPEAWVSDESLVSDFGEPLDEISKKLGVSVERSDFIWQVAAKLAALGKGN